MVDPESIMITRAAMEEVQALTASELTAVTEFLRKLQRNPFDPDLMRETQADGDVFASEVGRRFLYWTIESREESSTKTETPRQMIRVLALVSPNVRGVVASGSKIAAVPA